MPPRRAFIDRLLDFAGGLVAGVSDIGRRKVNYFKVAENMEPAPLGAHSVRRGTQRACSATLAKEPHTLMEWVSTAGVANKYVGCKGSPNGFLYRMTGSAFAAQTTPAALSASSWLAWCQMNKVLVATEETGAGAPMFFGPTNAADTWLSIALPAPGNTLTLTAGTDAAGAMALGAYYYRLRWVFENGSSEASTPQTVTLAGVQNKVDITTIPASGRTDYTGWILERTRVGMPAQGPFRYLASGTGASYTDKLNDADLSYVSDDNLHKGFPDGHAVGLIPFKDRLFGWVGSVLYASQAIGDEESTGIFNFDARNGFPFGQDDGESIHCVVQSNDRLIVIKDWSVWALEGNDLTNFRVVQIYKGAGASGSRAAASMGGVVWFFGKAGLHRLDGNSVRPFGWVEVGPFLKALATSARVADVVVKNHLGQRLLIAFSSDTVRNNDMLVYDLRYGEWSGRWTGIYAQDILVQHVASFGDNTSFLYADSRDRASSDFRPMIGYYGQRDEKAADGSGGTSVHIALKTPEIDGGAPDVVKLLRRVELFAQGSRCVVSVTITVHPTEASAVVTLNVPGTVAKWGGGAKWGDGTKWGSSSTNASTLSGLPDSLIGKRYDALVVADVPDDLTFKGLVVDGIAMPERRL